MWAHSANGYGNRHTIADHLGETARLASQFAEPFGASDAARWLGLWHDLGKLHPAWQAYLLQAEATGVRGGPDHKLAGTLLAARHLELGAFALQGHHGGLRSRAELKGFIADERLTRPAQEALVLARSVLADIEPPGTIPLPAWVQQPREAEFFVRMLFSALVDADYLDTESHFDAARRVRRSSGQPDIRSLRDAFDANEKAEAALRPDTPVNRVRAEVLASCLESAGHAPGLFRLTVPTGGGKTRAGLAFALHHARRHALRRVVVAVPYITVTEQTAREYRRVLGAGAVLEHHSGVSDGGDGRDHGWEKLASENWDAPVVVTTTVQLFESLLGRSPSVTRKLHRLARSVIVLDEAQTLPRGLLEPALAVLTELSTHYGTTVVFSTATQPAFESIRSFSALRATEIVPGYGIHFAALERVRYEWRQEPPEGWEAFARELGGRPQVLAVLNTRRQARDLFAALPPEGTLHLSTLMCGRHRAAVVAQVRRRLLEGLPCRLVSTQLIEAGVDLDFPVVYRAVGPLDSIVQAAGRCNREGKLGPAGGQVVVFVPPDGGMPPGDYATAASISRRFLDRDDAIARPEVQTEYFKELFRSVDTDGRGIQKLRAEFDYPEVASRFRLIEPSESVAVLYGTKRERQFVIGALERLRAGAPGARQLLRRLQPYLVSFRMSEAERWRRAGMIEPVTTGLGLWTGEYDAATGVVLPEGAKEDE